MRSGRGVEIPELLRLRLVETSDRRVRTAELLAKRSSVRLRRRAVVVALLLVLLVVLLLIHVLDVVDGPAETILTRWWTVLVPSLCVYLSVLVGLSILPTFCFVSVSFPFSVLRSPLSPLFFSLFFSFLFPVNWAVSRHSWVGNKSERMNVGREGKSGKQTTSRARKVQKLARRHQTCQAR